MKRINKVLKSVKGIDDDTMMEMLMNSSSKYDDNGMGGLEEAFDSASAEMDEPMELQSHENEPDMDEKKLKMKNNVAHKVAALQLKKLKGVKSVTKPRAKPKSPKGK